jgi:DNA-binding NtrC family response regulator
MEKTEFKILIACGDLAYGQTLDGFLKRPGRSIERCHDVPGLLRLASRRSYEAMVLDLALDEQSHMDIVSFVLQKNPATRLILLFDPERMDRALEGIRLGAFFYLPRSCTPSDVALVVDKAVQNMSAQTTVDVYEQTVFEELVGRTEAMQRVIELIRKVAPTDSTVLLLGESGTGKEVVAHTLHRISPRRDKPFVAVNCAALPEALLESELFGHVRGAFTGAERDNPGLFSEADGGTIFLDEIGDMSLITQAKLLRVLQNGEVRPVGANTTRRVDVRVIAATNLDLLDAVQRHAFREDLYFRLNVVQIRIPPLRERMDALPALISHFVAQHNVRFSRNVRGVDETSAQYLRQYSYPGNVRELESIIAHAVIMADGDMIRAQDLPETVRHGAVRRLALAHDPDGSVMPLAAAEERHIRETLKALRGNQSLAAKKLGISRSTLWRKMKEYGIES